MNATILGPAGAATVLRGYLNGWRALGSRPRLTVYVSPRTCHLDFEREFGAPLTIVAVRDWLAVSRPALLRHIGLSRLVERCGADVVFTPHLLGRCRVPQVVHHPNITEFETRTWRALRLGHVRHAVRHLAAKRALRSAAGNLFQTQFHRSIAEELVPESRPRNHVIWNGVEQPERWTAPRASTPPHLLAIQSASPHKDNPIAIHALRHLHDGYPHVPWRLTMCGHGDWHPHLLLARSLGIEHAVHFAGFVERTELDVLLRDCLCLVSTSVSESFGLAPIEAMAAGCPVIACHASAIPEVVGDAGVLLPAHDAPGFAREIARIKEDAAHRADLIQRGLARSALFSWPDAASRLDQILERASANRARVCA